jgi:hypothetical protein
MKWKLVAALVASAVLIGGPAHAAPDTAESPAQEPRIIVFELQPMTPDAQAGSDQEQALLSMLLLQLLTALQSEGDNVDVQFVQPQSGERI